MLCSGHTPYKQSSISNGGQAIQFLLSYVMYRSYAKDYVIQELSHHCVIAVTFTIYCFLLREEETYQIASSEAMCAEIPDSEHGCGNEENSNNVIFTLFVCWLFTIPCLIRELTQCFTYCIHHGLAGFMHWLQSGWNWMEVFSYFIIVVVICRLQLLF